MKKCIECRLQQAIQMWFSPNGTITQSSVGNDAKAICKLCRFRRSILHNSRKRESKSNAISRPVCVFTDTLLSVGNSNTTGSYYVLECDDTNGCLTRMS